ncbi:hypothetical protein L1987_48679 [Smallanthus sonchifolius]|uniref:Uncharacterized protein n=1 Tax=Smallanthus sonchifolius TaxID=185202 RepID=A0ACB9FSN1_9ASTR|nr:hypothetical protein L1987_48679 [Smallanthus sonchifolius]
MNATTKQKESATNMNATTKQIKSATNMNAILSIVQPTCEFTATTTTTIHFSATTNTINLTTAFQNNYCVKIGSNVAFQNHYLHLILRSKIFWGRLHESVKIIPHKSGPRKVIPNTPSEL